MISEISNRRVLVHFLHLGGKNILQDAMHTKHFEFCIQPEPRAMMILSVSDIGTMKSCQQAAINYNKRLLEGLRLTHQVQ